MQEAYFDFHFHPVFKAFISQFEKQYPSGRGHDQFFKPFDLKNPITDTLDNEFLHILEGQCSLQQMEEGKFSLGVANVAPIERFFTYKDGVFGKILNSKFFTSPLDQALMDTIREGKISYYQLLLRELEIYHLLDKNNIIQLLTRKKNKFKAGKSNLVFSIEGGHALNRCMVGSSIDTDIMVTAADFTDALCNDFKQHPRLTPAQCLQNLHKAMWEMDMDIFSLVLTHLSNIEESFLATHAYGMKMLDAEESYPSGNGISRKGKAVIDAAYTMKQGEKKTPVLIDIKHMGLKSREDFYAYRKEKNYKHPIIASHMGVTGYNTTEWKDALKKSEVKRGDIPSIGIYTERKAAGKWGAINKTFSFNPWTINLMDDDIIEVINSKGLIGISLDVRILGWQNMLTKEDQIEYLSLEDFRHFFPNNKLALQNLPTEAMESWLVPTREERHPLSLCFNILHIVSVGKLFTAENPWDYICIGSDFDGLINPIINCRTSAKSGDLKATLLRWLPVAEKAYREENGGPELLQKDWQKEVEKVLYGNGHRFLQASGFMG